MVHRVTAAAALAAALLATAGCAADEGSASQDADRDSAETPTETASSSEAVPSEAVVAHAKAYAALVEHPVYVRVQTTEPEMLPAFVDDVTHGKLSATSNGNLWTFTDADGECATKLSTDKNGGEVYETTCAGVNVDEQFQEALDAALAP